MQTQIRRQIFAKSRDLELLNLIWIYIDQPGVLDRDINTVLDVFNC